MKRNAPIAILGRGVSLKKYMDYSNIFKRIYIVNKFIEEIALVGLEHFVNKSVVHIVGGGSKNLLPKKLYRALNITNVQTNRFGACGHTGKLKGMGMRALRLPSHMLQRGYPAATVNWEQASKHAPRMNYPELILKIKDSGGKERGWPTTGILAIELALCTQSVSEMYLFGFDLYRKDYLVKKMPQNPGRIFKSKMMFCHLGYMVQEFKHCKFYCASEVTINQPNWVNI